MNKKTIRLTALFLFVVFTAAACGLSSSPPTSSSIYEGDMANRSYADGENVARVNANGVKKTWKDYSEKFIWAEYAAPWCGTSPKQTAQLKKVSLKNTAHITVMTSEMDGYGHPANQNTAAGWASRHNLNPDNVLAAENLTSMTVPRHIFFSPEGHTLFDHTGFMSADEISAVINERSADWQSWKSSGKLARWMR